MISKAYGGRVLFADVTLRLNRENRIGLVGLNGAGKSTLSIILGEEEADSGSDVKERNVVFGYLPQGNAPGGLKKRCLNSPRPFRQNLPNFARSSVWDSTITSRGSMSKACDGAYNRFHELGGCQLDAKAK